MRCPWCQQPLADTAATCPSCKRDPRTHPSGERARTVLGVGAPGAAVSPLELPDLAAPTPLAKAAPHAPPSQPPADEPELEHGSLELALDLDAPSRAPAAAPQASVDDAIDEDLDAPIALETALAPARPQAPVRAPAKPLAPLLPASEAARAVDPIEILALADFGSAPRGWIDAVPYALRVERRRRELGRELARQRTLLGEAERACEETIARVVAAVRAGGGRDGDALAARLASVDAAAKERDGALRAASAEYAAEVARIDARVAELERKREGEEARAAAADAELAEKQKAHARAEAKVKRADIALRAAHDAARAAAGPNEKLAPPEHAARILELEAERSAAASELAPAERALADATAAATARGGELRNTRGQIAKLRDERSALERSASRRMGQHSAAAEEAEKARVRAYAEVGRELLRVSPELVPDAEREAAESAQRLVDERALALEKHARALGAFDAEGRKRGLVVLGVAAALALLLFAMVIRTAAR